MISLNTRQSGSSLVTQEAIALRLLVGGPGWRGGGAEILPRKSEPVHCCPQTIFLRNTFTFSALSIIRLKPNDLTNRLYLSSVWKFPFVHLRTSGRRLLTPRARVEEPLEKKTSATQPHVRHKAIKGANMAEGQTSINIPQLIAVAIVGFLAIRWFLNKPSSDPSSPSSRGRQVDVSKVDQVSAMFPQLDRRTIAWDLQRNGGYVAATTERVLGGRGLDNPPPSFQPNLPAPATATQGSRSTSGQNKPTPSQPDLITRYGLQSRISGKGKEPVPSEEQKRNAWSSDKNARAEGLKRRREEMILAARRKLESSQGEA